MEGVNSNMLYLIHCKNFCNCHNVPPPSTAKKKKKSENAGYLKNKLTAKELMVEHLPSKYEALNSILSTTKTK
jgi:hypothetical protein